MLQNPEYFLAQLTDTELHQWGEAVKAEMQRRTALKLREREMRPCPSTRVDERHD